MNIPDALSELGAQIGLPKLQLNDQGLCRVVFDGDLVIDFESRHEGRTLHLCSVLCPFEPVFQDEAFYSKLLQANFLGAGTGGAQFSISMPDEEVLLERSLDMETMDFTGFSQAVESFVNHLEGWQQKVAEQWQGADSEAETVVFQIRA